MRLAAAAAADDLIAEIRLASRLLSIQVSSDDASGSNLGEFSSYFYELFIIFLFNLFLFLLMPPQFIYC